MVGINVDALNTLINKNSFYLNSFDSNLNKLNGLIGDINSCYSGNSLEYLFNPLVLEIQNMKKISDIINGYTNVMSSVKYGYQQQSLNLKEKINHISSNL